MSQLGMRLLGRWNSLFDTGPLQKTITTRLGLDEARIADSPRTLLVNATDVRTGRRVTFSNRPVFRRGSRSRREDVMHGVSIQRILASCSIPLVYPWTFDPVTQAAYWDGAVVANTPLGVALDAAGAFPTEDVMEVIVVLMTPWRETPGSSPALPALPQDFSEAATWALDWALLASFRERLDLIDAYNRLRSIGLRTGDPELSAIRQMNVVIVSPQEFIPAARILDYDAHSDALIRLGYEAAARAFHAHFSILSPDDLARMQAEVEMAG
jgi:NTE family protein